jgi:hypothetical protein
MQDSPGHALKGNFGVAAENLLGRVGCGNGPRLPEVFPEQ